MTGDHSTLAPNTSANMMPARCMPSALVSPTSLLCWTTQSGRNMPTATRSPRDANEVMKASAIRGFFAASEKPFPTLAQSGSCG